MTRRFTTALVTGGAGFVGSHLCEQLLAAGLQVYCLDNLLTGRLENIAHLAADPAFHYLPADVTEHISVPNKIDLVLHFASPASPMDYLRLPIETMKAGSIGTLHALGLARQHGARFVLASTSETYGDPEVHPQREDYWGNVNPVGPRAVYDEAKRFGEALTTAYRTTHGVDTAIVRIFNTFGPRMRPNDGRAIPTFIDQALDGRPVTVAGDGSQTRSLCFVDDTVRGILAVARSTMTGPVNIGNSHEMTVLDLAQRVIDATGSSSPIQFIESPQDDPKVRRPDTSLIQRTLGWQPEMPWSEGLARTIGYFAALRAAV
jgi:dTDP-glucose 4,6-dehydratase